MTDSVKKLSGAEIIIEVLKEEKVDTVFGYPGGTVIYVYDALYRNGKGIRHILTSHEQGAAHAADGYARSTGKTGVCLVTSGPGATNLVTGIATAYMDSVPMVAITINVATDSLGKDSFQEVDIAGIVMPVTKHSFIVRKIDELETTLRRAFKIASSGRPGPVLVDITCDVTSEETCMCPERSEREALERFAHSKYREKDTDEFKSSVERAVKLLSKAKRPLLMVGGGAVISRADSEIREFVDRYGCPVTDTLMGKGAFDGKRKEYLGMCGIYGMPLAKRAIAEADVIIAAGTRFSERVIGNDSGFAGQADIIQIDIDKAELNKNVRVSSAVLGDVKEILAILNKKCGKTYEKIKKNAETWLDELKKTEAAAPDNNSFNGNSIVRTIYEMTAGKALITTEVGQNQMWTANNYLFEFSGQLMTSGGLGTMGYGLGAAIGTKLGNPDRTVINIGGDGCFRMNMNELMTAVRYRLPIICVIINNSALGMVRQMQALGFENRFCETEFRDSPDYVAVAKALGADGVHVTDTEELKNALKAAVKKQDGPFVIDCAVSEKDMV